ncbi:hypothetical protein N7524_009027 [Penicillium chrysogenum]|nr:hypothetical protein N7524_009027 [Penicillium chrysogenum]
MALKKTSPDSHQGLTPPDSLTKESTMSPATLKDLMLLFGEFLENALLDLADQEPPNTPVSQDQSPPGLDMVRLNWDKEACKYRIAELTETSNDLDDYAEYAFVVRERVDRTSKEVVSFIDIKSEGLRDILRDVLHDIKAVSLMEDKPSIEQNVLFHFLPELDRCVENMDSSSDYESAHAKHLLLLIEHLKHKYTSTL